MNGPNQKNTIRVIPSQASPAPAEPTVPVRLPPPPDEGAIVGSGGDFCRAFEHELRSGKMTDGLKVAIAELLRIPKEDARGLEIDLKPIVFNGEPAYQLSVRDGMKNGHRHQYGTTVLAEDGRVLASDRAKYEPYNRAVDEILSLFETYPKRQNFLKQVDPQRWPEVAALAPKSQELWINSEIPVRLGWENQRVTRVYGHYYDAVGAYRSEPIATIFEHPAGNFISVEPDVRRRCLRAAERQLPVSVGDRPGR